MIFFESFTIRAAGVAFFLLFGNLNLLYFFCSLYTQLCCKLWRNSRFLLFFAEFSNRNSPLNIENYHIFCIFAKKTTCVALKYGGYKLKCDICIEIEPKIVLD